MSRFSADWLLVWSLRLCAAVSGAIVLLIVAFLFWRALPALNQVGLTRFFTDSGWSPAGSGDGTFNLLPMILGTLAVTAGAVLLSTPLGIGAALFTQFYGPKWLARPYRRIVELLAGIPSVVYGFWGLVVLVPLIGAYQPPGASLFAGVVVLTLMILPTMALTADSAFAAVPRSYFEGAAALGLTRWQVIRKVAVPSARDGLIAGMILQVARAIGETMAVLMVCGNVVQVPDGVFEPVRTLTANIALEMAYAMDVHRSALFVSGLLLMAVVVVLVALAEWSYREPAHG
jgi:phosphate transport system permease protein